MPLADDALCIRRAVKEDRRAMEALIHLAWLRSYSSFLGASVVIGVLTGRIKPQGPWREGVGAVIGDWMAERGTRILGSARLCARNGPDAELAQMHVLQMSQGIGVGTALWNTCFAEARGRGYRGMRLWVFERSEAAVRFYEHRGAVRIERSIMLLGQHAEPILCMHFALGRALQVPADGGA